MTDVNGRLFSRSASADGFTLIEVLISLVILSVGIVLVLRAMDTSLVAIRESRDSLWADFVIKEKMADVQAAISAGEVQAAGKAGTLASPGGTYRWETAGRRVATSPVKRENEKYPDVLTEITVTVSRDGSTRQYSSTTYIRAPKDLTEKSGY